MSPRILDRLTARSFDKALQRAERSLRPIMVSGETMISADICYGGGDIGAILSHRAPKFHVVVSNMALYIIQRGGRTDRLTSNEISDVNIPEPPDSGDFAAQVAWAAAGDFGRLIVITLWGGMKVILLPMGKQVATFGPQLRRLVPDRTIAEHDIDLGGDSKVKVLQRRGQPNAIGFDWDFEPAPGVDVDSEPLRSIFDEKMQALMREAGDPNARPA